MSTPVTLTWAEFHAAASTGLERQTRALAEGKGHNLIGWKLGEWRPDSWVHQTAAHIAGAVGEMAYCRARNIYWPATVDGFRTIPDVGTQIEIRTRIDHHRDLPVRPSDPENRIIVLVTGSAPDMRVVGWIDGAAARNQQWWCDPGDYGRPAWFVPQSALRPFP